jgi:hypothetical protein
MNKIKTSTPFRLGARRPLVWTVEKIAPKPTAKVMTLPVRSPAFGKGRETSDQPRVAA